MQNRMLFPSLFLILLTSVVYYSSLDNSFQYDDGHTIVDNPWIRDVNNIKKFFISQTVVSESPQAENYRPVLMTTYALNYAWRGLDPFTFHLVNLVLHILTVLACFSLIYLLLNRNLQAAFWGALLFAIHPINAEAVNYISARSTILSSLFSILSIILYYLFRSNERDRKFVQSFNLYCLLLISSVLAVLSKETALILPGLFLITDLAFQGPPPHASLKKALVVYIPWVGIVLSYWWIRGYRLSESIIADHSLIEPSQPIPVLSGILTGIKIVVSYLLLLLWPMRLSIEHHPVRVLTPFEWNTILSLVVFVLLLLAIVKCWRPYRVVSFCLLWFLISLLPIFYLPLITDVALMQENRAYLSVMGMMMLAGWGIGIFLEKARSGYKAAGIIAIAILCLSYITVVLQRNQVWEDQLSLWSDAVRKSPSSPEAHLSLATIHYQKGNVPLAMQELQETLQRAPQDGMAYHVLGGIYGDQGQLDQAAKAYELSLKYAPRYWKTYTNLGSVLYRQGHIDLAIARFRQGLEMNPNDWLTHLSLITAYARQNNLALILDEYARAVRQYPGLFYNYYGLGVAYELTGETRRAIEAYNGAVQVYPKFSEGFVRLCKLSVLTKQYEIARDHCMASIMIDNNHEAHSLLGLIAEHRDNFQQAILHYKESLKYKPNNAEVYYNLGNAYRRVGQVQEAVEAYHATIRLNPHFKPARFNLARLLEDQNQFTEAAKQYQEIVDQANSRLDDQITLMALIRLQGLTGSLQSTGLIENRK
jgi:tetratricopeptide (TPR) repeat protein